MRNEKLMTFIFMHSVSNFLTLNLFFWKILLVLTFLFTSTPFWT